MKNKLLLFIFFISSNHFLFSQICAVPPSNKSQLEKTVLIKSNNQFLLNSTSICISVKYHIVRETNGTGGFNYLNLNNDTNRLNAAFNQHKIYFNSIGYDFIDNSTYL